LVGELHDVERIDALGDVGDRLGRGLGVGASQVDRHRPKPGLSLVAELVVERREGLCVVALLGPHHSTVAVVVGDHGEIAMAPTIGDLVDADAIEIVQAGIVDLVGDHAHDDVGDRLL
jgi:hypothetical protein